jgi:iron complex outermembrane receptor protein
MHHAAAVANLLVWALAVPWLPARAAVPPEEPADTAVISGRVRSQEGEPVADATVVIVGLQWRTGTDAEGRYILAGVPLGRHVLEAVSPRHGTSIREVAVSAPGEMSLDITLEVAVLREEIVVSADAEERGPAGIERPTSTLAGEDLDERLKPTLGETLAATPGVSSTGFAAGASRPVIRGWSGDRVRILEDGLGLADVSSAREDNAVGSDPFGAEAIEIVRGPAALLYGSNAIGGIVNVFEGRIPTAVPGHVVGGAAQIRAGSAADEQGEHLMVDGGWEAVAWRASGLNRDAGDVQTPAGRLDNSDFETAQSSLGASAVFGRGYTGLAHQGFETDYGIPTPRKIRVDMQRRTWELSGEARRREGPLGVRVRLGRTDYDHDEIVSTGVVGTHIDLEAREGRFELAHRWPGRPEGVFGAQYGERDAVVTGVEAFVPSNRTRDRSLFLFEDLPAGPVTFQVGGRWDGRDTDAPGTSLPARALRGPSASGGLVWRTDPDLEFGATLTYSTRLPTAEELYANGPHLSTFRFEIGDPNLDEENSRGFEVSARAGAGRVTGEVSLFASEFDGYIFLTPTGNTIQVDREEVPEHITLQRDARFRGAEALVSVELFRREAHRLRLDLRGDAVTAEILETGAPLPRIPPARYGLGVRYEGPHGWARLEGIHVTEQDRVALFETPTDGYSLINASCGVRYVSDSAVHVVVIALTNLGDSLARNHVSSLKEIAPLPGRDLSVGYKVLF